MSRQYINTAIDYPNAAPHMGHAMEKILADVCARWFRLRGDEVRFQVGTDEHGIKIQRTAEKEGVTPQELVDRNAVLFKDLFDKLNISYDFFVRTSNKKIHYPTVLEMWKKLAKDGWLEKRSYTGLYCVGCEEFKTKRDLEDGMCVNHKKAPEEVKEENWFFRLSDRSDYLKELLSKKPEDGGYKVVPEFRSKEVFSFIEQGLPDVSFSRPKSTLYWGVPVPDDKDQVMYVWCDNLTNYISTLGYLTDKEDKKWWDDAEVTHVIGKDITRFHALNWPAMLDCVGIKTPDRLLVHGFLTSEGEKMSKSTGNVVVPDEVLEKFGGDPDPLRFYLSHEVPVGRDGDFSWDRIEKLYDSKLRNDLGNLLNRVLVLLKKERGKLGDFGSDPKLLGDKWKKYQESMNAFRLEDGVSLAVELATECNQFIDKNKPWELKGDEKINLLTQLAEALRHVALMLLPFTPGTSERILKQLDLKAPATLEGKTDWGAEKSWKKVGEAEILFEPLE
ncbi:MAG: methionine--tRNA ligase [Candidatus Peribacteraceae bacterium]|jgi:methionyl-tRNA synthetase|nr:methionine--tRNA ligase [Candidatus Peribacteraceae bacterium]MDP7454510.1 methionine--tRNA ligase [Candidatus Peribacteraceae bacterium]|tara:strand:- start:503 stop:2011 length:1509 start_codon:yes stop_codon:yes gene_type:complete